MRRVMVVEVALLLVQDLVLEVVEAIRMFLSAGVTLFIDIYLCSRVRVNVGSFGMGSSFGGRAGDGGDDDCDPSPSRRMIDVFLQKFESTNET